MNHEHDQERGDPFSNLNDAIVSESFTSNFATGAGQSRADHTVLPGEFVSIEEAQEPTKRKPNKRLLIGIAGVGGLAISGVLVASAMGFLDDKPAHSRSTQLPASLVQAQPTKALPPPPPASNAINEAEAPQAEQSGATANPALAALSQAQPVQTVAPQQSEPVAQTTIAEKANDRGQEAAVTASPAPAKAPATAKTPETADASKTVEVIVAKTAGVAAKDDTPHAQTVKDRPVAASKPVVRAVSANKPQPTVARPTTPKPHGTPVEPAIAAKTQAQPSASPQATQTLSGEAVKPLYKVTAKEIGLESFAREALTLNTSFGRTTVKAGDVLPTGERVQFLDAQGLTIVTDRRVIQVTSQ